MNLYCFDRELNVIELGKGDCSTALERFEQCYLNGQTTYEYGEEAIAATTFGISRSDEDYLEISCHGMDQVTLSSDRLCYPSLLSRLFSLKKQLSIDTNKETAKAVISDYFTMQREAFEEKYSGYLCR
ncbi:MAG: hypothetical protein JW818_14300 [Pirellulales bacterium]|nr:hypothetical protein [Pirellulales bacterium]